VFDRRVEKDGEVATILDVVVEAFALDEQEALSRTSETGRFPSDWQRDLVFKGAGIKRGLGIRVSGRWKRYRARTEAILLEGSYCLSGGSFRGRLIGPAVDVISDHPGEGWVELADNDPAPSSSVVITLLNRGGVRTALREEYGPKAVRQSDHR